MTENNRKEINKFLKAGKQSAYRYLISMTDKSKIK